MHVVFFKMKPGNIVYLQVNIIRLILITTINNNIFVKTCNNQSDPKHGLLPEQTGVQPTIVA